MSELFGNWSNNMDGHGPLEKRNIILVVLFCGVKNFFLIILIFIIFYVHPPLKLN